MGDLLTYVETAARDNMKSHIEVADMIQRESNTLLTLLLSGGGGALAYAAQQSSSAPETALPALCASIYLFVLSAIVSGRCLSLVSYPAASNEPRNLLKGSFPLEELRKFELDLLQRRIDEAFEINESRASSLNICRYAAAFTFAIPVLVWLVAHRS